MASDGKVVISTALDNSGFEKGIKTITGQLGGLGGTLKNIAGMLAAAFSTKKIIEFAAESSQAAMTLSDAFTGLKSILDGQGRSFSDAQAFIEEYTEDGLIPATNAITAYKNLASRGYDDSQIRQVMTALKDASAYGRQASYTMGEAVESATEGLKNENSILVDNAGVTKNVAKMWDEYAASIGATANNLTQEQKIQAEVSGILAETKYQTGDAATVAGTLSGQLQQLSFRFNDLKVAVGNAINPIVQTFLPIINTAITALTKFANSIASVVGALFGKASVQTSSLADSNDSVTSTASAGAAAEQDLADATEAAGKVAKKSLASFDELNTLQSDTGSGSSTGTSSGGASSGTSIAVEAEVDDELSPKLQTVVNIVKEVIGTFEQLVDLIAGKISFTEFAASLTPLQSVLLSIAATLATIVSATAGLKIVGVLQGMATSVKALEATSLVGKIVEVFTIVATGAGTLSEALNFVFGAVATTAAGIGTVVGGIVLTVTNFFSMLSNGFSWLKEILMVIGIAIAAVGAIILGAPALVTGIIAAIVAAVATAIVVIKEHWAEITTWFDQYIIQPVSEFFTNLWSTISALASQAWEAIKEFFSPAVEWFSALLGSISQTFSDIFYNIGVIASGCWEIIQAVWGIMASWFDQNIVQPVASLFSSLWGGICTVFSAAANWFNQNVIQPVASLFKALWGEISNWAAGVWGSICAVFGNVVSFFKGILNGVIGALNSALGWIFGGINEILNSLRSIELLGMTPFSGLRTISTPQIPYLAQGAVLPANKPFLAMVGDQKHGTNIEAPESAIYEQARKAVNDVLGGSDLHRVVDLLERIAEKDTAINMDGRQVANVVTKYQRSVSRARGG